MKVFIALVLLTVLAASVLCQTDGEPVMERPFVSDSCSLFPDGDYGSCCVTHDKAYYFGGTDAERKVADRELRECVRAKGHKYLSRIMWLGVRVGGVSFLPTPFRWGFGNKWPRKSPK